METDQPISDNIAIWIFIQKLDVEDEGEGELVGEGLS